MPRLYMQVERMGEEAGGDAVQQLGQRIQYQHSIGSPFLRAIDKQERRKFRNGASTRPPPPPPPPSVRCCRKGRKDLGRIGTTRGVKIMVLAPLRKIGASPSKTLIVTPRESKVPEKVRVAAAMQPPSPDSSPSSPGPEDDGKRTKSIAVSDRDYLNAADAEMRLFFLSSGADPALLFPRPLEEFKAFGYTGGAFVREVDFCREFCSERGMQICMGLPPILAASPERQIFFMKCKNMVLQAYADLAKEGVFIHMHAVELATLMCLWLSISGCDDDSQNKPPETIERMSLSHDMLPKTAACMISIAMKHTENVRIPYQHLQKWIDRARELDKAAWKDAAFPSTHAMESDIMNRIGWRVWHRPTVSSMLFVTGLMRPGYPDECYEKLRFIVSSVLLAEAQTCSDASLLTVRCMDPAALALACFDVMVHGCTEETLYEVARCCGLCVDEAPVWTRAALVAHARARILDVADASNTLLLRRSAIGGELPRDPYYACLRGLVNRAACYA